jgi:hypothetical protein
MISGKLLPLLLVGMLGWLAGSVALGASQGPGLPVAGRLYGPTTQKNKK